MSGSPTDVDTDERNVASGNDNSDEPAEISVSDLLRAIRDFLSDPEAGKRFDAVIAVFKQRIELNATERKTIAEAQHKLFVKMLWVRSALSAGVLLAVTVLGWNGIISGEAVVGLFGAFAGYLWGDRQSRTSGD